MRAININGDITDNYSNLRRIRQINAEDTISFSVPKSFDELIQVEKPVTIEGIGKYLIKEIDRSLTGVTKVYCKYDVDDLLTYIDFKQTQGYLATVLSAFFTDTGWTWSGTDVQIVRQVIVQNSNLYEAILAMRKTFDAEIRIDNLTKTITYGPTLGTDRGAYFSSELNVDKLDYKADTLDYFNRIIPIGAGGIGIASLNGGVPYLENLTHNSKIITMYWEDNRYTNTETLKAEAQRKLDVASNPLEVYTVQVKDLSEDDRYAILSYEIGDIGHIMDEGIQHRIVKIDENLNDGFLNVISFANKPLSIAQENKELKQIINENWQYTNAQFNVLDNQIRSRVTMEEILTDPEIQDALKGADGQDATKTWTHVKFARDGVGTDMSDLPEDRTYIGIGMEKPYPTPSTDHLEYYWGTFRNSSYGISLRDGKFAWVKFADTNKGIGMSNNPEGKRYVGIAIETSQYEGNNAHDYGWAPIYEREIIVQPTEPTEVYPTGQIWLDTSLVPSQLKRWTGSEWEVVNDTSQLENILSGKLGEQDVQDLIEAIAGNMISTSETEISQTTDAITQRVTQTIAALDAYGRHLTALEEKQEMVWRLTADGIEFGQTGNPIRTIQKPDRYAFVDQAGNEVAYFSNWELYVTALRIPSDGAFKHGPLMWAFRDNGNYDLIRVGE